MKMRLISASMLLLASGGLSAAPLDLNQPCVLTEGAVLGAGFKGHDTRAVAKSLEAAGGEKDEFETTAQFQERIASVVSRQPAAIAIGALCVTHEEVRPSVVSYDADAQILWIDIETLANDIRSDTWNKSSGEHEANNAYGATVTVSSYRYNTASVNFVRERLDAQLKKAKGVEYHQGPYVRHRSIPVSLTNDVARNMKGNVGVVYLYGVVPPYQEKDTVYSPGTFDRPTELFIKTLVVSGELKSVAVINKKSGAVLKVIRMEENKQ